MSIGPLKRLTKLFNFNIVNFDFPRWHNYEHENWDLMDALLGVYVTGGGLKGLWKNSTNYIVNDRVIDADESKIYLCLVNHTSAAEPITFASNRLSNPTYWRATTYEPEGTGAWTGPGTVYGKDSFVVSGNKYAIAIDDHVSGATFNDDVAAGHWEILIDLTGSLAPVEASIAAETDARIADVNAEETARINADNAITTTLGDKLNRVGDYPTLLNWTTGTRPGAPAVGMMGYNTTLGGFEGYSGAGWGSLGGGATGGGPDKIFNLNDQTVTTNYTIPAGKNAVTAGPITINSGVTVEVSSGSAWAIV